MFLFVRADLKSARIEYEHFQCALIGLKILILRASGLQIPMNGDVEILDTLFLYTIKNSSKVFFRKGMMHW